MFRKWNRVLAFLLSIVLITTTFGSDFTSTFAYAAEDAQDLQNLAAENGDLPEIFEEGQTISDLDEEKNDTETQKETQEKPQEESQTESQEVGDETISEEEVEKDPETVVTDLEEEASSEGEDEEPAEPEYELEFNQSQEVNGIEVSLWAAKEVLPDDAVLSVEAVSEDEEEQIKELIDGETGDDVTVEKTISFDININAPSMETEENPSGKVQPKEGTVAVTFTSVEEVSEGDIDVYHVADNGESVEKVDDVDVDVEEETVSFDASHFSTYTIVLKNGSNNRVSFNVDIYDVDGNSIGNATTVKVDFEDQKTYQLSEIAAKVNPNADRYSFDSAWVYAPGSMGIYGWQEITSFYAYSKGKKNKTYHLEVNYSYTSLMGGGVRNKTISVSDDTDIEFDFTDNQATVPVAVYATDGTADGVVNSQLKTRLGLNYKQDDGYYPLGVINLPKSLFANGKDGKNGRTIYLNNESDVKKLTDALSSVSLNTSVLQNNGLRNAGNTVFNANNLKYLQLDYGKANGDHATSLMQWEWAEHADAYNLGNATNINTNGIDSKYLTDGGCYKFHLDLRFATNSIKYIGLYYENDTYKGSADLGSEAFLTGEPVTKEAATTAAINRNASTNYSEYLLAENGLFTDRDLVSHFTGIDSINSDNTTIYVKFIKTTKHNVSFNINKPNETVVVNNVPQNYQVDHNTTIAAPNPAPTVADNTYVFDGWYLGNEEYDFDTPVTTDITLVAHWKSNTATYTVNHWKQKLNGNANQKNEQNYDLIEVDTTRPTGIVGTTIENVPTKDYEGFNAPNKQSVVVTVDNNGNGNAVVNYYYTRKTYTVNYNANAPQGEIVTGNTQSQSFPYEGSVDIRSALTCEHYDFAGWYTVADTVGGIKYNAGQSYNASNYTVDTLNLYARWTPKMYTITFMDGERTSSADGKGAVISSEQVAYGSATPAVEEPTWALYDFKGWSPAKATTVTGDATYVATWEKTYKNPVTISAKTIVQDYDGTTISAGIDSEKTGLPTGFSVTNVKYKNVTKNETGLDAISIKDAGSISYEIESYDIVDDKGVKVPDNYFTVTESLSGKLTVNKRKVYFRTGDAHKTFDGTALTCTDVYVGEGSQVVAEKDSEGYTPISLVDGETIRIKPTSSRMLWGEEPNDDYSDLYVGDNAKASNYQLVPSYGKLTVYKKNAGLTIKAKDGNFDYDGKEHAESGFTTSSGFDGFYVEASMKDGCVITNYSKDGVVNEIDPESVHIYLDSTKETEVTGSFEGIKYVAGKLTINKLNIAVKSDGAKRAYDGQPLTAKNVQLVSGSLAEGQTLNQIVTFDNFASITEVGKKDNTYDYHENTHYDYFQNYVIDYQKGELEIEKYAGSVVLTAPSDEKDYDGTALTAEAVLAKADKKVTETGLANGDYAVVVTSGSVTNVNDTDKALKIDSYKIYHQKGAEKNPEVDTEVTTSYDLDKISTVSGTLTINPVTYFVKTGSATKKYDGKPLTKTDGAEIVGLVNGEDEKVSLTVTGTVTDVTTEPVSNEYSWNWNRVNSANYTHGEDQLGTLQVFANDEAQVTISVPAADKIYDGTALSNGEVSITVVGEGISAGDFTVSDVTFETVEENAVAATSSVSITDAGSVTYRVSGYKIVAKDGTNATSYFTKVSKPEATLTVYPRTVKVTSVSDHKTYDGTALTNSETTEELVSKVTWNNKEYDQTGDVFVNGEGFTYNVTGSVTYVSEGEVDNAFTFAANEGTAAGNYRILPEFGKLYITNRSDAEKYVVEVKANSYEDKYDGAEHKAEGFKTTYPGAEEPVEGTEFTIDNRSYVVEGIRASRTEKNVPEEGTDYTVAVQGTPVVYALDETAENGKVDVTEQFALTTTDGSIKITPRNVTLTSVSGSKTYDGNELTGATLLEKNEAYFGDVKIDDAFKAVNTVTEEGIVITGDGFVDGEGATYTVTGSQTTPTFSSNAFTFTLKEGTFARNYNISKVEGTLTVNSRDAKYEIAVYPNSKTEVYDGKVKAVSGFSKVVYADTNEFVVGKDGKLKFSIAGNEYTITGLEVNNVENAVNAGEYLVTISNVGNQYKVLDAQGNDVKSEFRLTTGQGKLNIRKRVVILTSKGDTKQYDGKPLKKEKVDVSWPKDDDYPQTYGFVKGDGVTYSNFKSQTLVTKGDGVDNTFDYTFSGSSADNYEIIKQYGKLKVTDRKNPFKVTVKANSKTETYTGDYITVSGFEKKVGKKTFVETENGLEFTEGGVKFYITGLTATQTMRDVNRKTAADKVKSYEVPVSGKAVVKDAAGNDVTKQFAVKTEAGKLTINPIKITFTSGDAEKEYDGDPLTNDEVKVTSGAFAQGEEAVFTVTGSQTLPTKNRVKENNTFTYKLVNTREANYDVKTKFGSLWVKNRSDANKWKIELKGNSKTDYYNGNKQTISGFEKMTFEFNNHTYYVSGVTSSAKGTDVLYKDGKVVAKDTKIEGKPKVKDEAGHDVTKSFKVTVKEGTLLINPRPVTLTSADGRKKYDGTPLTTFDLVKKGELDKEVTVGGMGFVKNHGKKIHYTVTGSQTIVGSSSNEFTYKFENSIKDIGKNYAITKNYGTLTVETRGADNRFEVVVVANSDEFLYDGTEHSVSGFKEVRVKVGENKYDTYEVKGGVLEFKLNGETFKITDVSTIAGVATDVMLNEVTDETGAKKYAEAPAAVVSVSDTSLAKVTDSNNNPVTSEFAVYSEDGTLTIHRRKVTLVAGSASKDFDGSALTCPEYSIKTGEGIDGFAVYTKDGKEVNEKNGITVTTSGSALRPEDSPAENEIAKVDFDGVIAKASNYIVTTEKGKLTINSLGKKIVLDITLELDQDGGNNKEVTYNGKQQSMDVTIGITPKKITETEETQTTTEGGNTETPSPITQNSDDNDEGDASDLSAMIGKLMSLGTITVYAAEGEDIFEDVEQLKYNSTATFTYGDTTFVVSGITLEGGAGTDVGEYPVTINLNNLSVTVGKTVDGKVVADEEAPVNEFAFNVIKPETSAEGNNVVGVLNIVEKEITVSTGSASKDYDGNPLTSNVASIDGIVNGETYKITATGSRTEVGTSKNTYKIDWAAEDNDYTAKETNYKIVGENLGDLRVDRVSSGGGGGDDTPVFFTLAAPAPAGAVLGAQRVVGDGPAVLGARRSSTDDNTNSMARVFAMVAAAAIAVTVMITGKKKKDEEEG